MQNFYADHYQEAFGRMGEVLGLDFNFESKVSWTAMGFLFEPCGAPVRC